MAAASFPEGPGTLLLRGEGLKNRYITDLGPWFLKNWVSGPSGIDC